MAQYSFLALVPTTATMVLAATLPLQAQRLQPGGPGDGARDDGVPLHPRGRATRQDRRAPAEAAPGRDGAARDRHARRYHAGAEPQRVEPHRRRMDRPRHRGMDGRHGPVPAAGAAVLAYRTDRRAATRHPGRRRAPSPPRPRRRSRAVALLVTTAPQPRHARPMTRPTNEDSCDTSSMTNGLPSVALTARFLALCDHYGAQRLALRIVAAGRNAGVPRLPQHDRWAEWNAGEMRAAVEHLERQCARR